MHLCYDSILKRVINIYNHINNNIRKNFINNYMSNKQYLVFKTLSKPPKMQKRSVLSQQVTAYLKSTVT